MAKILLQNITDKDKARFWSKVEKCLVDDCWRWLACVDENGRGKFSVNKGVVRAADFSLMISGNLPKEDEKHPAHICKNRGCVNPAHLSWVPNGKRASPPRSVAHLRHEYYSEYMCWQNIKQRCRNPDRPNFKNYGGRGITMHEEWFHNFESFLNHVGPKPQPGLSLDRIDNEKGYVPFNVRWATIRVQNNNKRPPFRGIDLPYAIGYLSTVPMHYCF